MRLIKNKKNRGAMVIASEILSQLRGEYVYFAAADDYVPPYFFAEAMDWARRWTR